MTKINDTKVLNTGHKLLKNIMGGFKDITEIYKRNWQLKKSCDQ